MGLWLGVIKISKPIFGSSLTLQGMHDTQWDVFMFLYTGWHNSDGIKNTSGNKYVQDVNTKTQSDPFVAQQIAKRTNVQRKPALRT